jgi:hypothetical protein
MSSGTETAKSPDISEIVTQLDTAPGTKVDPSASNVAVPDANGLITVVNPKSG